MKPIIDSVTDALTRLISALNQALNLRGPSEAAAEQVEDINRRIAENEKRADQLRAAQGQAAAGGYATQGPFAAIGKAAGPFHSDELDQLDAEHAALTAQRDRITELARETARGEAFARGPLQTVPPPTPKPEKAGRAGRAEKEPKEEDFSGGFDQAKIFSQEEQAVSALRQIDDSYLAAFKSNMQALVAEHKITKEQQYGFEIQYTAQLHDQERQRLEAMLADDNATTEEKTRVYLQLLELDARYTAQVEADQAKIVEAQPATATKMAQTFTQMFDQIGSTFEQTIAGMIEQTTTWQQGMQKIFSQVLQDFIKMIGDMLSQWAASGLASLLGVNAGEGAGLGAVLGKGLAGLFSGGGGNQHFSGGVNGAGDVVENAATSFGIGSIFKSLFGGIGSLFGFQHGGIVPSAQGGWAVTSMGPGGVLAQLHSNEMVLPAGISSGLQNMIAGGGSSPTVAPIFNIQAMDSQSFARFAKANAATFVAAINLAMRNGSAVRTS